MAIAEWFARKTVRPPLDFPYFLTSERGCSVGFGFIRMAKRQITTTTVQWFAFLATATATSVAVDGDSDGEP